ncbi:hypothetical protein A3C37_02570 [Candidatus Peribacteria bacterium RIFCSPHIGHO2_02_FULL_53_20]|nr:MAG: hypothetical protein A3C37_02570 [Candidatus Peribacteria bacterium RIFCSPHIGHO2_02_FULL_53_20]OGJ67791.1 MAG: hypothetical protein A3B61_03450 [Candidatus Peribacteria bacterium RIFCSPLOWO2_01_FULL_53_10]OGJ69516.1 MAG: hypothetical protein A3G69_02235 [Candidatus Peribacteria bacterium RIFCSPLOWO2_12_FULL_53_10]
MTAAASAAFWITRERTPAHARDALPTVGASAKTSTQHSVGHNLSNLTFFVAGQHAIAAEIALRRALTVAQALLAFTTVTVHITFTRHER